jgi:hypothetical protein
MGEMLEGNASLKEIDIWGENPLNSHSYPGVIYTCSKQHVFIYGGRVVVSFTEGVMFLFSLFVCWTADNDAIGDEGAIEIAKGLEKNTSLIVLHVGSGFPSHLFFIRSCIFGSVLSHSHTMDEL